MFQLFLWICLIVSVSWCQNLQNIPECQIPMELLHLQDVSDSFRDHATEFADQYQIVLDNILEDYPDAKTGLAVFSDKPVGIFGYPPDPTLSFEGDVCLDVVHPIQSHRNPIDVIKTTLLKTRSGKDFPENQLGALFDVAKNGYIVNWSTKKHTDDGRLIRKVVVLATNSVPHLAGDGNRYKLQRNDGFGVTRCDSEDYPTLNQVASALLEQDIYLIILAAGTTFLDADVEVINVYQDVLRMLNVPGQVYSIEADYHSDLRAKMKVALDDFRSEACNRFAADVAVLFDLSHSFNDDLNNFRSSLNQLTEVMPRDYLTVRVAIASFIDKPFENFGYKISGDYCWKVEHDFTDNYDQIVETSQKLITRSGRDWYESQLDAILSAAVDNSLSWVEDSSDVTFRRLRSIVLATDSGYHKAGDWQAAPRPRTDLAVTDCYNEDFPTVQQVANALIKKNIYLLLVIANPQIESMYNDLVNEFVAAGVRCSSVNVHKSGSFEHALVRDALYELLNNQSYYG